MFRRSSLRRVAGPALRSALQLPKQPQTIRPYSWSEAKKRFGVAEEVPPPLKDTPRDDAHRLRVAGWTPVARPTGDVRLRVALVGRMNAGKSSVFNMLRRGGAAAAASRERRQVVKMEAGITRDSVEGVCYCHPHASSSTSSSDVDELGSGPFTLIDTPGIIEGKVVEEALRSVATADLVIMVCAVDADVSDDERNLAAFLAARRMPTLLVVNKMDLVGIPHQHDSTAEDAEAAVLAPFATLGLGEALPISTRRDDGADMLRAAVAPFFHLHAMRKVESDWAVEDAALRGDVRAMEDIRQRNTYDDNIKVAIVGRTNSGKSSLLNRIVGFERVRVADEKNTTRDPVEVSCTYRGRNLTLIDTAGLLRRRHQHDRDFLTRLHELTVEEIRFAHVVVVVFDATEGHPNKHDMSLLHRVANEGRPFLLCANKWDAVLDPSATAEAIDFKIKRQTQEAKYASAVVVSALTGLNLTLLLDTTLELYDTWNKRVRTAELTRFWRKMEKSVVIPRHYSRIGRLSQVNTRPPTFLLNLQTKNDEETYNRAMQEMLKSAIVEEFGFKGVPVRLIQEVRDAHPDWI